MSYTIGKLLQCRLPLFKTCLLVAKKWIHTNSPKKNGFVIGGYLSEKLGIKRQMPSENKIERVPSKDQIQVLEVHTYTLRKHLKQYKYYCGTHICCRYFIFEWSKLVIYKARFSKLIMYVYTLKLDFDIINGASLLSLNACATSDVQRVYPYGHNQWMILPLIVFFHLELIGSPLTWTYITPRILPLWSFISSFGW